MMSGDEPQPPPLAGAAAGAGAAARSSSSRGDAPSSAAAAATPARAAPSSTPLTLSPLPPARQPPAPHAALVKRRRLQFALRDLALLDTVGTGTFGRVRVVVHRASGATYALKILKKSEILRLKQLEHIKNEVRLLMQVAHPFIVNMHGHLQDDKRLFMLLEYAPGGELFSHLRRDGHFGDDHARFYAAQITLAFEYLHSFKIVYRCVAGWWAGVGRADPHSRRARASLTRPATPPARPSFSRPPLRPHHPPVPSATAATSSPRTCY
jgi:hypothetical protein